MSNPFTQRMKRAEEQTGSHLPAQFELITRTDAATPASKNKRNPSKPTAAKAAIAAASLVITLGGWGLFAASDAARNSPVQEIAAVPSPTQSDASAISIAIDSLPKVTLPTATAETMTINTPSVQALSATDTPVPTATPNNTATSTPMPTPTETVRPTTQPQPQVQPRVRTRSSR